MAGETDDTGTLMSLHDEALILGEQFPTHEITVAGTGSGLRLMAKRKPDATGPFMLVGSASELKRVLGGGKAK